MKRSSYNPILLCTILSIFLFSCNSLQKTEVTSNEASLPEYEYKTYRIESNKPLEAPDTTYYSLVYPVFSDPKINEYVQNNIVLDSGKTSIEQMGEEFIKDFDKFYDEVEYKRAWFQEKKDSVTIQSENYIGFSSEYYAYTGGAHGNYYTMFNNYDVKQNKEILLNDIISADKLAAVTKIAEEIFRKQEGITATHSLTDGYFFDEGIFYLPKNFILKDDGILFLYNIYEIKPYVSGITELLIPYTSIQELMTQEGKEFSTEIQKN